MTDKKTYNTPMWIASFPRSGNTFVRNVMHMAYGLSSSTYGFDSNGHLLFDGFADHPLIKTHQRPLELPGKLRSAHSIYLIRDGRDALVSMAHHRKDIVEKGTDFLANLQESIIAAEGSFFGGWSTNVFEWIGRADLVIRYEDLILDPIRQIEKCRSFMDLAEPKAGAVPDFDTLKKGQGLYTDELRKGSDKNWDQVANKFFRKGKAGGWRDEMPEDLHDFFWSLHGSAMDAVGYAKDEPHLSESEFEMRIADLKQDINRTPKKTYHILLEGSKILDPYQDGIKRYVYGLMKGFAMLPAHQSAAFKIDLYSKGVIRSLLPAPVEEREMESKQDLGLNQLDYYVNLYERFKAFLRRILPKSVYRFMQAFYVKLSVKKTINGILKLYLDLYFRYAQTKIKKLSADYDLIHVTLPQNIKPFRLAQSKILVTVHDLTHRLFPQFHTRENNRNAEKGFKMAERVNANLLAVSLNTKKDLLASYTFDAQQVFTSYEAVDHERFQMIRNPDLRKNMRRKYGLGSQPYFLSLFTLEPRKNIGNTIDAYKDFRKSNPNTKVQLAIAGRIGWKTDRKQYEGSGIIFIGYVEEDDLAAMYSEALAFCYASFYEGFGLPLLEAMRCKTPVIYGDNSSMSEIVADAGLPANAENVSSISDCMSQLANDTKLRAELSKRAFQRSLDFDWGKTAYKTMAIYKAIIERDQISTKDKNE